LTTVQQPCYISLHKEDIMIKTRWYQQGDVTIRPAVIPTGGTDRGRVLAYGEVTGHCHQLTEASDGLLVEVEGVLFLRVGAGGAEIVHEEHKPITVPPGEYVVGRVQEYDHFSEEARQVRD
jgi:hypothetical protein